MKSEGKKEDKSVSDPGHLILLELGLLVGFLGERARCNWWSTSFYESVGATFMSPVFGKTIQLAQYHGTREAARLVHDEHLSVGSFHLFRLPEEVEQDMHILVQTHQGAEVARRATRDAKESFDRLGQLAKSSKSSSVAGPVAVGSIKTISSPDAVEAMASVYRSAFTGGAKAYPYLVG